MVALCTTTTPSTVSGMTIQATPTSSQQQTTTLLLKNRVVPISTSPKHNKKKKKIELSNDNDDEQQKHSSSSYPSVILPKLNKMPDSSLWSKVSIKALKERGERSLTDEGKEIEEEAMAEMIWNWDKSEKLQTISGLLTAELASAGWMDWSFQTEQELHEKLQIIQSDILNSLEAFSTFCETYLEPTKIGGYKCKLSIMIGNSGTRCPSWHQDYVPIRCIQTLQGPGCWYIDPCLPQNAANTNLQQVMNGFYEHSIKERLLGEASSSDDSDKIKFQQAPTGGQPILLVGKAWNQWAKKSESSSNNGNQSRQGVLHRSPRDIPSSQTRVLLTLDVVGASRGGNNNNSNDEHHHHHHGHSEDCGCAKEA